MMKKILIIILLNISFSHSQSKNGEAIYTVALAETEKNEIFESLTNMYKNAESSVSHLSFVLQFDSTRSCFFVEDKDVPLDSDIGVAAFLVGFSSQKIWSDSKFFYKMPKFLSYKSDAVIIKNPSNFSWNIDSESKKIDGFTCYKAVGSILSGDNKKPILAWFCPDIPYSYGPLGIGGLPGLILELHTQEAVYGLKSLKFNDEIKVEPFPEKAKIVTDEEYGKLIKEEKSNR